MFLLRRLILTETSRGSLIWVDPPGLHCVVAESALLCEEGELGQGKWRHRQRGLFAHQAFDLGGREVGRVQILQRAEKARSDPFSHSHVFHPEL